MGRGGGLVLLGGIRKLAAQTVPDLMQKFLATSGNEHTRFELHTESSFTADLLQAVAEERLDMAFVSHPGDDTVFENVAFARLPFVVVAPPNHPLAQKSSVTLRVIYALSDFLIMILSWLVKQSLRAFLFQEVQP